MLRIFRSLYSKPSRFAEISRRQLHDVAEYFNYTRAIVGSVPNSFATESLRCTEPSSPVDLSNARKQLENYVSALKSTSGVGLKIHRIEPDDRFPDLVFVEDPAVVLDGVALLTKMQPPSRSGEIGPMQKTLEEVGLKVVQMSRPDAYLDGGDVLFTGREVLIGLSKRTNKAGIEEFAKVFKDWKVTAVRVGGGVLHLKSMSSMCGVDTIAIGAGAAGQQAWQDIESQALHKYKRVAFPDNNGANCLFINGTIFHPPKEEYPDSYKIWETFDCPKVPLPNSEMAKADGSLTCNSIRIN